MFDSYGAATNKSQLASTKVRSAGALGYLAFNDDNRTMITNVLNVEVSDTTNDDSSNAAGYIINFILKNYNY